MDHSICKSILIGTFIKLKSKLSYLFFFSFNEHILNYFLTQQSIVLTYKYFEVFFSFFLFFFL